MADYKATAAQLASIANAIRLKFGETSGLEYPSEWEDLIESGVIASGGSEITPADPTAEYKVTSTELTAIADAIRTRGGTAAQLEFPTDFVSAINAFNGSIPSWSSATDAEIAAVVAALDAGTLTIAGTGWNIGDERQCSLAAASSYGDIYEQSAQTVTLVLMDSQHYDLVGGGKDHFVVGLKGTLSSSVRLKSSSYTAYSWQASDIRHWLSNNFKAAFPEAIRGCFKPFYLTTAASNTGTTLLSTEDTFAFFAEKEVLGERVKSNASEADVLSQIAYYQDGHRSKSKGWWLRSPGGSSNNYACLIDSSGESSTAGANNRYYLSPFGCI